MNPLEVLSDRFALKMSGNRFDWRIRLADTIADNASSGALVLGEPFPLEGVALASVSCSLQLNGEKVESSKWSRGARQSSRCRCLVGKHNRRARTGRGYVLCAGPLPPRQ